MSKANTKALQSVEDRLEDVAASLHDVAKHLSDETAEAVTEAAKGVARAADNVRTRAASEVKITAHKVAEGIREHPVASLAAAITAAAALIGAIAVAKAHSSKS